MKNYHFSNLGLQNKINPDSITPNTRFRTQTQEVVCYSQTLKIGNNNVIESKACVGKNNIDKWLHYWGLLQAKYM